MGGRTSQGRIPNPTKKFVIPIREVHTDGTSDRDEIGSPDSRFFGETLFRGGKVARQFVEEMVYGIQASVSVRLSEIVCSLVEKSSVKKRLDRLSRNLDDKALGSEISAGILAEGAGRIEQDTLRIVDPTDMTKEYAKNGVPRQG